MMGFRDQSDLGERAHLAGAAKSHFDSWDQKVHSSACLTISLASRGCHNLPLHEVVTLVDEEVVENAGDNYEQVILVAVGNAHDLEAIALYMIEPAHTEAAVNGQRQANESQSQ